MIIAIDVFGGDNSPHAAIDGSILFLKKNGDEDVTISLFGDEKIIKDVLNERGFSSKRLTVVHAPDVIECSEQPTAAMKNKPKSSMMSALRAVAENEAQCVVSSGSTGALLVGATFIVKRIHGVKRPALTPIIPTVNGSCFLLIDSGANADCKSEYLAQFAIMGSVYMNAMMGVASPRVALLSNGTEPQKGNELVREAYSKIESLPLNFVGNIEGRDVLSGSMDVCVCDGMSGNILLKTLEGAMSGFSSLLKSELKSGGVITKLGAAMIKPRLRGFKKKFDYRETGGALLLGVNGGVIKAHGSSDALAFYNAIKQATAFVNNKVVEKTAAGINECCGE